MYMGQSLESFENWRDSQVNRPEPDTEAPEDKQAQREHREHREQSEPASPTPIRKHKKQEMER